MDELKTAADIFNKSLLPLKKGVASKWMARNKAYAVNIPLSGNKIQILKYSLFGVTHGRTIGGRGAKKAYKDKYGGGLAIAPSWHVVKDNVPLSKAEAVVKLIKGAETIESALAKQLKDTEGKEGFKVPSKAKNALIAAADSAAKRRLGVTKTPKDEFFHFDTAKKYKMDSWGKVSGLPESVSECLEAVKRELERRHL